MSDAPKPKMRVRPLRWPNLNRVLIDEHHPPEIGQVVIITGEEYVVENVIETKQFELEVRKVP